MQSTQTASGSMGISSGELLLSLRAWSGETLKDEDIPFLIARINAQRGSFRNITESSLEQEVEAADASPPGEEDEKSPEPDTSDGKTSTEDVYKARGEIARMIGQAAQETAYSLDFISLLLSKHTPRQAESTISPFLKQSVPLGSLGTERNQVVQPSATKKKDDDLTVLGWKLQSLSNTADSLLSTASKLESEMEKEAKYWEQVLSVKEQGWSLSRLPREKHTLGVRYGFAEASREFSDRGLAALRRRDDGTIELDLGIRATANTLRVRLQQKGKIIASSSIRREASMDSLEPLTRAILQARNDIFDEELFHEIYREARTLTNRGVRCNRDTIIIPSEPDKRILVDVVPVDTGDSESDDFPRSETEFVNILANALRILLSHAHRQNLKRRSQPPPALTEKPPQRPSYFILRPVLDYLCHKPASLQVSRFLRDLKATLRQAKLNLAIDDSGITSGLTNAFNSLLQKPTQVSEALVELLSRAMFHIYKLTLPSGKQLTLHVRTGNMGVEYKVTQQSDGKASAPLSVEARTFEEVKRQIWINIRHDMMTLIELEMEGKRWQMSSPYSGELSLDRGFRQQAQTLLLDLSDKGLSVRWDGRENVREREGSITWSGRENSLSGSSHGLIELVKSIAQGFETNL